MKNRIRAALVAATLTAATVTTMAPANAQDSRPCVSKRESRGHHHGMKRADVERVWEVRNRGGAGIMSALIVPAFNTYIIDYPSCGFNDREAGVAVFYREDDNTVRFVMRYWSDTATPHGNPRTR